MIVRLLCYCSMIICATRHPMQNDDDGDDDDYEEYDGS